MATPGDRGTSVFWMILVLFVATLLVIVVTIALAEGNWGGGHSDESHAEESQSEDG